MQTTATDAVDGYRRAEEEAWRRDSRRALSY